MNDPRRLLVVDDDVRAARILARMLREDGYEVTVAGGGVEAIDELTGEAPDALITDLEMPTCDGVAVARYARFCRPDLPIFVVTGNPELASMLRAMSPPARVFTKPIDYDEVARAIEGAAPQGQRH